jgi:hypothetical protein
MFQIRYRHISISALDSNLEPSQDPTLDQYRHGLTINTVVGSVVDPGHFGS